MFNQVVWPLISKEQGPCRESGLSCSISFGISYRTSTLFSLELVHLVEHTLARKHPQCIFPNVVSIKVFPGVIPRKGAAYNQAMKTAKLVNAKASVQRQVSLSSDF